MSNFPMSGSCSSSHIVEFCGDSAASSVAAGEPTLLPVQMLTPLDFTYVVYDASTPHSQALAYLTFLPILLGLGLIQTVVLRRDLEAIYQAAGLLLSTAISQILKRIIQEPRPHGSAKTGYGMPSDHAQFSFFFVVYISFWIRYRSRLPLLQKRLLIFLLFATAFLVCYSRVHLGVHSVAQVAVGCMVGCVLGALWGAWARVCVWSHIFPLLERSRWGQRWSLKDCSSLPPGVRSAVQFEYQCYMDSKDKDEAHKRAAAGGLSAASCPYLTKQKSGEVVPSTATPEDDKTK